MGLGWFRCIFRHRGCTVASTAADSTIALRRSERIGSFHHQHRDAEHITFKSERQSLYNSNMPYAFPFPLVSLTTTTYSFVKQFYVGRVRGQAYRQRSRKKGHTEGRRRVFFHIESVLYTLLTTRKKYLAVLISQPPCLDLIVYWTNSF